MVDLEVKAGTPVSSSNADESEITSMLRGSTSKLRKVRISSHGDIIASPSVKADLAQVQYPSVRTNLPILGSVVAPLIVLIWWTVGFIKDQSGILAASIIGGQLSYTQAKAIDFVCSALFAPLLMVLLDHIWFSSARVLVVNEKRNGTGVPISTLVEASSASAGGFNLLKIRSLLQGKTWRLFLLSLMILLSGFANKMLSNFIAYEAFNADVPNSHQVTLKTMSDAYINHFSSLFDTSGQGGSIAQSNLSISRQADVANQMAALLTGLNFESAVSKLEEGMAYIGTNSTSVSLNAVNSTVIGLTNVPGYRLSIDCQPGLPTFLEPLQMGETFFDFTVLFDCPTPTPSCGAIYMASIPGMMSIGSATANNEEYQYAAFLSNFTQVYLGYLYSFNDTYSLPSSYGEVFPLSFNATPYGFQDTKGLMTTWGISCAISRQEGFHNYTRQPGQAWSIQESSFSNEKSIIKSFLGYWQLPLSYSAPGATIAGLGPPLATTAGGVVDKSVNWTVLALNYLYASGEAQRISYEATGAETPDQPQFLYNVSAAVTVQHYRITYIPLLLVLGLVGVIGAAIMTAAMAFYNRDTRSAQLARKVTTLRLLVDSVAGLQDSVSSVAAAGSLNEDELDKWASKFRVAYSEDFEEGGSSYLDFLSSFCYSWETGDSTDGSFWFDDLFTFNDFNRLPTSDVRSNHNPEPLDEATAAYSQPFSDLSSTRDNTPTDLHVSFYNSFTSITNGDYDISASACPGPALEDAIDDWVGIADFLGLVYDAHQRVENLETPWITTNDSSTEVCTPFLRDASFHIPPLFQPENAPPSTGHSTIGTSSSPDTRSPTQTLLDMEVSVSSPPRDATHQSADAIQCTWPSCEKSFRTMTEYNHHFKNHSKPFICPQCPARRATKRHLDRHINEKHIGSECYYCPVEGCKRARRGKGGGRGFPRIENCRRHVRKVHKGEVEWRDGVEVEVDIDVDEETMKVVFGRRLNRKVPDESTTFR
ncbi:hypothetical protein BDZ45DRAFT_728270 [Acephala macrosclerotiorum]|nr:hypothetical protein BDZ45DRAFT_728270 [Acephala macrosclerotiorum]